MSRKRYVLGKPFDEDLARLVPEPRDPDEDKLKAGLVRPAEATE